MISIYVKHLTPRVDYIFKLIFNQLLGLNFTIVSSVEQYLNCSGAKLCYHDQRIDEGLFIEATNLLFSNDTDVNISEFGEFNGLPTFYFTKNETDSLPFDLFAASFYLVTRMEEYHPKTVDQHNRFQGSDSIAFKKGFLQLPMINLWVNAFKKILSNQFPDLNFQSPSFQFVPSYDIDHAWAFKNKGWFRNTLQLTKSLLQLNVKQTRLIRNVLNNNQDDPFDTFSYLETTFTKNKVVPIFFFLLGQYGKHDKNVSIKSKNLKKLIQQISQQYPVGIHPSYRAHHQPTQLKSEQQTLNQFINQPITNSRQHYLLLKLPETYRHLIEIGITDDYTMGYADQPGFRASIAHPFPWYDLLNETTTSLTIHPFQFMDVTLKNYLQQTPDQAKETIKQLINSTKAVDGQLISLWHNSSLSDYDGWDGWRAVHDYVFECVKEK